MDGSKRSQLSFVGNGANPTNKEAMTWFMDSIFHLIKDKHHDMKLIIIGLLPLPPLIRSFNRLCQVLIGSISPQSILNIKIRS
jgi:hypothetical protein